MNIDQLISPIPGSSPCGDDMLFSPEFDEIQHARQFDDPSLSQGEWVTALKEADWAGVVRQCSELLSTRTKDLRLAVWITEALAKTRGVAGLGDGYLLIARLCNAYWEDLHPRAEDGEHEARVGNLDWLLSQSARLVSEFRVTRSPKGAYSLSDLETARALAQAIERAPHDADALMREARVTQAQFDAARADTAPVFYTESLAAARAAQAGLDTLQRVIDEHLGDEGPSFSAARGALQAFVGTLERFAGRSAPAPGTDDCETPDAQDPVPDEPGACEASATPQFSGPIRTRAQAIAQLRQVAAYFRHTEPHSPVAYLADKAAKWGEMDLHEWLRTVVKDGGALSHVEELLGVPQGGHDGT